MTKRLTISLLLCFLAFAIISNRLVPLRQVAMAADSNANVHQPLDYLIRCGFTGRFLAPETQQDEFDVQKAVPPFLIAGDGFRDAGHRMRLESNASPKPPAYILQSVLNL